jgi:ABC-type oligopeptide transport system substrate-binding subunit/tetratricopeptide (TPR) repeat protein
MASYLGIYLLGSPRVELDGEEVHIPRRKAMALLAYLAVTGQVHQRDALAALLWPENDASNARAEVRRTLWQLNRDLGAGWLVADRETAGLAADVVPGGSHPGGHLRRAARTADAQEDLADRVLWLDVRAFQDRLAACEAHDHPRDEPCGDCVPLLEEAVALYRDDFLAGFTLPDSAQFDEWQFFQTQSLRDGLAGVLGRLAAWYGAQEEHVRAIGHARRWLSLDILHEPAHRALMRLYAASGQRAAALRQYRQCVHVLEEELGLPPAEETTALYERVRSERPQPAQAAALAPPALPAFLGEDEDERPHPLFVARELELAQLERHLQAALDGQGSVAFVGGDAGRGKTALMAEFARRATAAHPDLLVGWGNCNTHAGLGDPYLPFREILNALTGDVAGRWAAGTVSRGQARRLWEAMPTAAQVLLAHGDALFDRFVSGSAFLSRAEVAAPPGAPWLGQLRERVHGERVGPGDVAQDQLLGQVTAVLRALSAEHALLLCLDDLQWVDAASAGLLFQLGRQLHGSRILIVGAYRPDEVALRRGGERHPMAPVLAELKRRYGDVWVDLREADEREGRGFVDAFLDTQPNRLGQGFRAALYQHTGGHPLFTVELLRAMQARGDMVHDGEGRWVEGPALHWEQLPARVEAVIEARLGRLPPELHEVLAVASVEGETFTVQVVAQVQGMGERPLLHALSRELEGRHQLVREEEVVPVGGRQLARYRFGHALYQQHLYDELGEGERALLHGEVGDALEALYADHADEIVSQLAHHYAEAGDAEKAIPYLDRAGDQARLAYAYREAVGHYERAMGYLRHGEAYEDAARTSMKLGLTHHDALQFEEARRAYDEGFALWQRGSTSPIAMPYPSAPHALRLVALEPVTLDPAFAVDRTSQEVIHQLFSGLATSTPELGLVPEVAQRWEVVDGGRRYVFHLRERVCWRDGTPVTAGDFEYAWKRALDPATGTSIAHRLYQIQGARAYHQGETADPDTVGVRSLDEATLELWLEGAASSPSDLFVNNTQALPVPRHVVQTHGSAWTEAAHIVTNGPFRLVAWERGAWMALERDPGYTGHVAGNIERVEMLLGAEDRSRALQMYEQDRLDALDVLHLPRAEWDRARLQHPGEYLSGPVLSARVVGFDANRPPFDDRRVRRAFVLATDRETLAHVVLKGYAFPATGGTVLPGVPGHSPGIGLPYAPAEARRLLAEAGYPGGRGFPSVEALAFVVDPISEYLRDQWARKLGVEIAWTRTTAGEMGDRMILGRGRPPLWCSGIFYDPVPEQILRVLSKVLGWQDAAFAGLLEAARATGDQDRRIEIYQQADRTLIEEAAVLPLTYDRFHVLIKPWVAHYPTSPLIRRFWKDVVLEPH